MIKELKNLSYMERRKGLDLFPGEENAQKGFQNGIPVCKGQLQKGLWIYPLKKPHVKDNG